MKFRPILIGALLVCLSTTVNGKDDPCSDNMLVEVTGTVKETYANKAGGITIILTGGYAKCLEKVSTVFVSEPIKPSCKPGAKLVAKVPLHDTIVMLLYGDAVSYACR
jgi:hypothetical protein